MKYKCLVLDHDDTVVDSTKEIHFPCFLKYLKFYRPEFLGKYTLDLYFERNFDPGISEFLSKEIGLSDKEVEEEEKFWADYVTSHIPKAYDGIRQIIERFYQNGGIVAVASHSYKRYILRDYEYNSLPAPTVVYGWDLPKDKRKPSPYAIFDIIDKYGIDKSEILVVDDLKPGYDMARSAGVDFAAAAWAYNIPKIRDFMRQRCDYFLENVGELYSLLFG